MNRNNFSLVTLIVLAILLSLSFTVFSFIKEIQKPKLPIYSQIQQFSLLDSKNKSFTLDHLLGKIWIADFFFTTCDSLCPIMTKNMAAFHQSFKLLDNVSLVSISVNPDYDTSGILKRYSKKYNANTNKWHFLTGKHEQIKELAVNSFKLGSIEEPVFHSSKFTLVDKNGFVRGYYEGTDKEEINQLLKDTAVLLKEK